MCQGRRQEITVSVLTLVLLISPFLSVNVRSVFRISYEGTAVGSGIDVAIPAESTVEEPDWADSFDPPDRGVRESAPIPVRLWVPGKTALELEIAADPAARESTRPCFATQTIPPPISEEEQARKAWELLFLINEHREGLSLQPLEMVEPLWEAAWWRANDMAANDYFGHTSSNGLRPNEVAQLLGYIGWEVGECIAATSWDAHAIFLAWMNSPPHRGFIEYAPLSHAGVGFGYNPDSEYGVYVSFLGGCDGNTYPTVPSPPILAVKPQKVVLLIATNREYTTASVNVQNTGDELLSWTVTADSDLIAIGPMDGVNDGRILIRPSEALLARPDLPASGTVLEVAVTINGNEGSLGSPATVAVKLLFVEEIHRTYLPLTLSR